MFGEIITDSPIKPQKPGPSPFIEVGPKIHLEPVPNEDFHEMNKSYNTAPKKLFKIHESERDVMTSKSSERRSIISKEESLNIFESPTKIFEKTKIPEESLFFGQTSDESSVVSRPLSAIKPSFR